MMSSLERYLQIPLDWQMAVEMASRTDYMMDLTRVSGKVLLRQPQMVDCWAERRAEMMDY